MASTTSTPKHQISELSPGSRCISIHDWTITATSKSIVTAAESDTLQKTLLFPLPEMTFGSNELHLVHNRSGWEYRFDSLEALKHVKNGELGDGDGGVKVGYADAWLRSRTEPGSFIPLPKTILTKPYDWTYTSTYTGHCISKSSSTDFEPRNPDNNDHWIPIHELTRPDPILFYAEIPLYEDELHDNGASHFSVRLRVMPGSFFILARFTLRVDNVLFRTLDTRIFHSFKSIPPLIIKETSGWEAPYDEVRNSLPTKDDLTPLTDPNFISKTFSLLPQHLTQVEGAKTGWRGLGTKTEVATLELRQQNLRALEST